MFMESNTVFCVDLLTLNYSKALELQRKIVSAKKKQELGSDVLLLLEHAPVFTLGKRGGIENLVVPKSFLDEKQIPIVPVERGGNITYHGPGQLVCYPIVNIAMRKIRVVDFVDKLEEVIIRTAREWSIIATRDSRNRGVWVGNNKLGSIGICVTRGITFHGFSLNVNTDLEPFSWINPCGLNNAGVTSMAKELSMKIIMDQVKKQIKSHMEQVFRFTIKERQNLDFVQ